MPQSKKYSFKKKEKERKQIFEVSLFFAGKTKA